MRLPRKNISRVESLNRGCRSAGVPACEFTGRPAPCSFAPRRLRYTVHGQNCCRGDLPPANQPSALRYLRLLQRQRDADHTVPCLGRDDFEFAVVGLDDFAAHGQAEI